MIRNLASVIAVCIAFSGLLPAKADDSVKGAAMIPVRIIAFAAGAVVGTPIAVLRYSCKNTTDMSGQLAKENDKNPLLRGACAVSTLPFAVMKGGLEGVYHGTANSWENSSEHPFSGDSFSLGEIKE